MRIVKLAHRSGVWTRGSVAALALLLTLTACGDGAEPPPPSPTPTEAASSPTPTPEPPETAELAVVVGPDSVAGWWDGGAWVNAEGQQEVPAEAGDSYAVIRLDDPIRSAQGSAVGPGCETNPGTHSIDIPGLERVFDRDVPPAVAVSGVDNPRPRPLEPLNIISGLYLNAAREILGDLGVDDPSPIVAQVVRADLDGDGRDEVLVVAERIAAEGLLAQPGDYSVVFMRRIAGEGEDVVTTIVEQSIPEIAPGVTPFVLSHRVSAAADFNGDGRMEVAISSRYYEGAGMAIYELNEDGALNPIMQSGCGA